MDIDKRLKTLEEKAIHSASISPEPFMILPVSEFRFLMKLVRELLKETGIEAEEKEK